MHVYEVNWFNCCFSEALGAGEMEDIRWAIFFGVHMWDNKKPIIHRYSDVCIYLRNIFGENRRTKASMSLHSNCIIIM